MKKRSNKDSKKKKKKHLHKWDCVHHGHQDAVPVMGHSVGHRQAMLS